MKIRDVVIGFLVLVLLIAGVIYLKNRNVKVSKTAIPTPNFQQVENKFPSLKVPENADRVNLNNVSGEAGMGEAWRTLANGEFNLTVLADLPVPKSGYFYQAWMFKDNSYLSLGKLSETKGGYVNEFKAGKDLSAYSKIVVTLEKVFDNSPEAHVLEGSF